jgi:hypothetical protein
MNSRVLMIVDALLVVAIAGLILATLMARVETPPPAPRIDEPAAPAGEMERETSYVGAYTQLGQRNIFATLIPLPPPPPPPPPPAVVPPSLAIIAESLELYGVFGDMAEIFDSRDQQRHEVQVGQPFQLASNLDPSVMLDITVAEIDGDNFTVTLQLQVPDQPLQQVTLSAF